MKFFYAHSYNLGRGLPVRAVHGFVLDRPSRTRAQLIEQHGVDVDAFVSPEPVPLSQFAGLHTDGLLAALQGSSGVARAVEMPVLKFLPSRFTYGAVTAPQLAAAAGTKAAMLAAADGAWCVNLSGGFHHARPDLAHGFCLLNDVALGVAALRARGLSRRIAIIDLDAHQGDGNAAAFAGDDDVVTLSVHEEALFPRPKLKSTIDVGVPSHLDDDAYLAYVDAALNVLARQSGGRTFELVVYIAGVDPHVRDPLSSLRVSASGLVRRDERVARFAKEHGAGFVMLPAGGYTQESPVLSAAGMHAAAQLAP